MSIQKITEKKIRSNFLYFIRNKNQILKNNTQDTVNHETSLSFPRVKNKQKTILELGEWPALSFVDRNDGGQP